MYKTSTVREKVYLFIKIFIPILIYQLANFSASFIDTMMTGQYATIDLAGVSMATSFWNPLFTFLMGIVSALIPIVSQHLGRGDREKIGRDFHQFVYLSLILSLVLVAVVLLGAGRFMGQLGLEPSVRTIGENYLYYLLLGVLPLFIFSVCRSFFDALGLTRLSMYLMLLLVPFNSFFNYVLIYGKLGFPSMGGAGVGLGTALAYWLLLLVNFLVLGWHPKVKPYQLWRFSTIDWQEIRAGFKLGLPIGGAIFAEVAIFAVVGFFMARYSSEMIASHQAAMNFATLMYAFPMSIASTLSITVAYEVGARRMAHAYTYGRLGRLLAFGFSAFTLIFLYLFRNQVASLYGADPAFVQRTSIFLAYSLCFQLADTYTAPVQGILRGYKDTKFPFIMGVLAYWGVSLPLALILEKYTNLGPYSFWIGLIVGIFACGALLGYRLKTIQKNLSYS